MSKTDKEHFCILTSAIERLQSRPAVNFINVLCTAFTLIDPESVKKIDNLTVLFTLLGSARVIAVRRPLMKLSPDFLCRQLSLPVLLTHQKHKMILEFELSISSEVGTIFKWILTILAKLFWSRINSNLRITFIRQINLSFLLFFLKPFLFNWI